MHTFRHPIIRRLGIVLVFMAAFQIAGGPSKVLQSVAWAGMIGKYTRTNGIRIGLAKTFDGQHPCALCCQAKKTREAERKQPPAEDLLKFDKKPVLFQDLSLKDFAMAAWHEMEWPAHTSHSLVRGGPPPTPPPNTHS